MLSDFPHLKPRYETFLFLPHNNCTFLLSQLCIYVWISQMQLEAGDNITVNYIQTSTQEVLDTVRANSILAGKRKSHELFVLTFSHVE